MKTPIPNLVNLTHRIGKISGKFLFNFQKPAINVDHNLNLRIKYDLVEKSFISRSFDVIVIFPIYGQFGSIWLLKYDATIIFSVYNQFGSIVGPNNS